MKKLFSLVLMFGMFCTALTACGGSSAEDRQTSSAVSQTSSSASAEVQPEGATSKTEVSQEPTAEPDQDVLNALISDLQGCIGQDETLTSVALSDKVLKVSVDLTQADSGILTAEDLAYSRASGITDKILSHNELDSEWDTVILDFGVTGSIQVGKSAIRTNEYDMRYMDSSQFQLK